MTRKQLRCILWTVAILCIALSLLHCTIPDVFPALMAFPFSQLGMGLRALSLSGSVGNAAAIVLYVLLCLLPALPLIFLRRKAPLQLEDSLLGVAVLSLFPILWLMINPGHMVLPGTEGIYAAVFWSIVLSWMVLRVLRSLFSADRSQLVLWFSRALRFLAVYYVFELCGVYFPALLEQLSIMQAASADSFELGFNETEVAFTVIHALLSALPAFLTLLLTLRSMDLMDALQDDREDLPDQAGRLSRFCGQILTASVLSTTFLNLLQLLLQDYLRNVSISVVIPVFELLLVFGVLLLCRFLAENKQLRDDNELFI